VGHRLAELGVLGRFAVDFVVAQDDAGRWQTYAVEINLRKGGTTHPYLFLQFLTDGEFNEEEGVFRAPSGVEKYYVASDHLEDTAAPGARPGTALRGPRRVRARDVIGTKPSCFCSLRADKNRNGGDVLRLALVATMMSFVLAACGDTCLEHG
jgi:hypothetical protein